MSFDAEHLRAAIRAHGRVARVVIAAASGSTPRETGAAMLVWEIGQSGTIGGGALELEATQRARAALGTGDRLDRIPLGPALGQCCGGAVTLLTEIWDARRLESVGEVFARPLPGQPSEMPLKVKARLRAARNLSAPPTSELLDGWMIEPVSPPRHALWLWGAGHVGRAIAATMAPLPDWQITWIDTAPERFPETLPDGVTQLVAADPPRAVPHATTDAHHLVLTYSHEIDLALCHALLSHGFASAGLIGSTTKWARFRKRLEQLGHSDASILRIACPIGDPSLGKAPQAIAIGVTALLLTSSKASPEAAMDRPA